MNGPFSKRKHTYQFGVKAEPHQEPSADNTQPGTPVFSFGGFNLNTKSSFLDLNSKTDGQQEAASPAVSDEELLKSYELAMHYEAGKPKLIKVKEKMDLYDLPDNRHLVISGLSDGTTEEDIRSICAICGTVHRVKVLSDRKTNFTITRAYVRMKDHEGATTVFEDLNGAELNDEELSVTWLKFTKTALDKMYPNLNLNEPVVEPTLPDLPDPGRMVQTPKEEEQFPAPFEGGTIPQPVPPPSDDLMTLPFPNLRIQPPPPQPALAPSLNNGGQKMSDSNGGTPTYLRQTPSDASGEIETILAQQQPPEAPEEEIPEAPVDESGVDAGDAAAVEAQEGEPETSPADEYAWLNEEDDFAFGQCYSCLSRYNFQNGLSCFFEQCCCTGMRSLLRVSQRKCGIQPEDLAALSRSESAEDLQETSREPYHQQSESRRRDTERQGRFGRDFNRRDRDDRPARLEDPRLNAPLFASPPKRKPQPLRTPLLESPSDQDFVVVDSVGAGDLPSVDDLPEQTSQSDRFKKWTQSRDQYLTEKRPPPVAVKTVSPSAPKVGPGSGWDKPQVGPGSGWNKKPVGPNTGWTLQSPVRGAAPIKIEKHSPLYKPRIVPQPVAPIEKQLTIPIIKVGSKPVKAKKRKRDLLEILECEVSPEKDSDRPTLTSSKAQVTKALTDEFLCRKYGCRPCILKLSRWSKHEIKKYKKQLRKRALLQRLSSPSPGTSLPLKKRKIAYSPDDDPTEDAGNVDSSVHKIADETPKAEVVKSHKQKAARHRIASDDEINTDISSREPTPSYFATPSEERKPKHKKTVRQRGKISGLAKESKPSGSEAGSDKPSTSAESSTIDSAIDAVISRSASRENIFTSLLSGSAERSTRKRRPSDTSSSVSSLAKSDKEVQAAKKRIKKSTEKKPAKSSKKVKAKTAKPAQSAVDEPSSSTVEEDAALQEEYNLRELQVMIERLSEDQIINPVFCVTEFIFDTAMTIGGLLSAVCDHGKSKLVNGFHNGCNGICNGGSFAELVSLSKLYARFMADVYENPIEGLNLNSIKLKMFDRYDKLVGRTRRKTKPPETLTLWEDKQKPVQQKEKRKKPTISKKSKEELLLQEYFEDMEKDKNEIVSKVVPSSIDEKDILMLLKKIFRGYPPEYAALRTDLSPINLLAELSLLQGCTFRIRLVSNSPRVCLTLSDRIPFYCALCPFVTKIESRFLGHLKRHQRRFSHRCNLCDLEANSAVEVALHQAVHKTTNHNMIFYQYNWHAGELPTMTCTSFVARLGLCTDELNMVENNDSWKQKCHLCHYKSEDPKLLKGHMLGHVFLCEFSCSGCGFSTTSKELLNEHFVYCSRQPKS